MLDITNHFDKIYIINLPYRKDRKKEIEAQLKTIGIKLSNDKVELFSAIRPDKQDEFDSIGTKGCFLSHLAVLDDAIANKHHNILILEDDVNFTKQFSIKMRNIIDYLAKNPWNIFYFGHKLSLQTTSVKLTKLAPSQHVPTSHFISLNAYAIKVVARELKLMLARKNGDPNGGPMHIDGAYSTIREKHPELITYAANPVVGFQRASRTDIHSNRWFDKIPVIKTSISILRKLKNTILQF